MGYFLVNLNEKGEGNGAAAGQHGGSLEKTCKLAGVAVAAVALNSGQIRPIDGLFVMEKGRGKGVTPKKGKGEVALVLEFRRWEAQRSGVNDSDENQPESTQK
ncbi:hypothetical protein FXO38_24416 [Capsicum annuum]|nr:hypothetical protein FXO38_24416 [Capsicum annuum]